MQEDEDNMECAKELDEIRWAAMEILRAMAEIQHDVQQVVSPTFTMRHDLDGDVMTSCGQA